MARWTRRVGIFTAVLMLASIGSNVIIFQQLQEMKAATELTKTQLRANVKMEPIGQSEVIPTGETDTIAWRVAPMWKNVGGTDAINAQLWWDFKIVQGPWNLKSGECPYTVPSSLIDSQLSVITPGDSRSEEPLDISRDDLTKLRLGQQHMFFFGHIEYRDVFPSTPLHFHDWCVLVLPDDPTHKSLSFLSIFEKVQ